MATTATPVPAAPAAPPAVTPAPAPASAPIHSGRDGLKSAIGDILSAPDTPSSTSTEAPAIEPVIETSPSAAPVEVKVETSTEPVAVTPSEGTVTAPTGVDFTPQEPVKFESRPESIAEETWNQVYPAYSFVQELQKPFEEGGIGHQPTLSDVHEYFNAYADRIAMEEDFASGDYNAGARFLDKWFGPDESGQPRNSTSVVASAIPAVLAQRNPQALLNMMQALPAAIKDNPQAVAAVAAPILSSFTNDLWNEWANTKDEGMKDSLWKAAQILTKKTTGQYRKFDDKGQPVAPEAPKVDTSYITQKEQELTQREQAFQRQQDEMWKTNIASQVSTQVDPLYDKALEPIKSFTTSAPRQFTRAKQDFISEVQQRVMKDPKWSLYVNLVNRAHATGDPDATAAIPDFYRDMAQRAISALQPGFLKDWGVTIKKASEAQHATQAKIDAKREPSTSGSPSPVAAPTNPMVRQKNETHMEFLKRTMAGITR
jgi:hypothetical protein